MKLFLLILVLFSVGCSRNFRQNNLSDKESPYLKKSSTDPIWWQNWDEETLKFAKKSDKLIFLSVGYASCFACEKMHQENETKPEVADILNESFISIKVDREQRPDLDSYFLNLQGSIMKFAAWPINIVMSPNLEPLFATTFAPTKRFVKFLKDSQKAWTDNRVELIEKSQKFLKMVKPVADAHEPFEKDQLLIKDFYARYTHRFDTIYGGIRTGPNFAPKFPVNDDMRLLLRHYKQTNEKQSIQMVKKTLSTIAKSAMFDQLEGGFHRYSSSRDWNSPNYEKMLMDQASFLNAYVDLQQVDPQDLYERVIEKTVDFLLKNFSKSGSGFYSSQAGSVDGKDGFYYTWQDHEIQAMLTPDEWKKFREFYTFSNPQRRFMLRRSLRKKTSFTSSEIEDIEKKILESDHKSKKPEKDKKIVTAQNAYMISSLARMGRVFPSEAFNNLLKKKMNRLLGQSRSWGGTLYRTSDQNHLATLDDYAFLIDALIEFYQLSFDEKYLFLAKQTQEQQDKNLFVKERNLYKFGQDDLAILQNQFLFRDQGRPSGLATTYWNLVRLARYFNSFEFSNRSKDLLDAYPERLRVDPLSYSSLLLGFDFELSNGKTLIASVNEKKDCSTEFKSFGQQYNPYYLTSCAHPKSKLPLHKGKKSKSKTDVGFYVCDLNSCFPKATSISEAIRKNI